MRPVVFGKRFGWLHAGAGTRGVVLCNTYGHEYVWTYSGLRHLADALAARGLWVLRFDYLGTGDSADLEAGQDLFDSAVDDIGSAVDFLKEQTGIEHVTLAGFRVGAAFALAAALKRPVDDLALLAPVVSGRTYIRELGAVRKTWLDQLAPPLREAQPKTGPLNVLGQVYDDAFRARLEKIDLASQVKSAADAPANRVLLMHARTSSKDPLLDALSGLGVDTQTQPFEDLLGFIQESAFTVLPKAALATATEWIANGALEAGPVNTSAAAHDVWPDLVIETPEAVERPVRMDEHGLVGVLCEPRHGAARGPVFVMTNTAASSRVGDSRLSVRIARELASRGIASLRFDARGRGDSPLPSGDVQSDTPFGRIYNVVATEDTGVAARWLSRQGYKTIYAFGICSGAYHALKAAVSESVITGVISVNIPTFKRPEDKTPEALRESTRNSMAGYAFSMLDPQKWKAILRGDKNLLRVMGFIGGYMLTRARSRVVDVLRLDSLSKTPPEQATTPMPIIRALDARGVNTVLVYGAYDAGLDLLAAHCGKLGARLKRLRSVRVATYADVDHSLFNAASLPQVIALCESVITQTNVQTEVPGVSQQRNHSSALTDQRV
ncbi:alpha/beta hydrolase [Caballeronia sp. GAWG1-1]|uniref:serine aminopeptidase domain-containing protein n=1 Tax=Caballeronia sp. GAWG1-1 TaxID=2921742 RepID=UPI0020292983|nr:alpha/beta hydrolase [Caballeronia sp. GAWG1-1]